MIIMNAKQYDISTRSRYSWTNLHKHNFVPCRKCGAPLVPSEFTPAVNDVSGKIVTARLPDRCAPCEVRKRDKADRKDK